MTFFAFAGASAPAGPVEAALEGLRSEEGSVRAEASAAIEKELARLDRAGDRKALSDVMGLLRGISVSEDLEQSVAAKALLAPYLAGARRWQCTVREGWQAAFTEDGVLVFDRRGATPALLSLLKDRTGEAVWSCKMKELAATTVPVCLKTAGSRILMGGKPFMTSGAAPVWVYDPVGPRMVWEDGFDRALGTMDPACGGILLGILSDGKDDTPAFSLGGMDFGLKETETGRLIWKSSIARLQHAIPVPFDEGILLAGTRFDEKLEGLEGWAGFLDGKTGKLLWERSLGDAWPIDAARSEGGVLFAFAPGDVEQKTGFFRFEGSPAKGGTMAWTGKIDMSAACLPPRPERQLGGAPPGSKGTGLPKGFCKCLSGGILAGQIRESAEGSDIWEIGLIKAADGAWAWRNRVELPKFGIVDIGPEGILLKWALKQRDAGFVQVELAIGLGVFRYRDADRE